MHLPKVSRSFRNPYFHVIKKKEHLTWSENDKASIGGCEIKTTPREQKVPAGSLPSPSLKLNGSLTVSLNDATS